MERLVESRLSLSEDEKSDFAYELTNMEFVNKHHDFNKIGREDLEAIFLKLRKRCPDSWKPEFENRTKELHRKFMILRGGRAARHIDPDVDYPTEGKDYESEVERLLVDPESWSMSTKERARELHEILRHFTMFAPFEGRPFIRAWLKALTPCVSRWILSYTTDESVDKTLRHFLGAFGQPGIVVCLEDKGASMLKTLQHCANSVEALGRGTVERYYWKSLAEATCGLGEEWKELESIENMPLIKSQLDTLATDWLQDANDWVPVFTNIVSPEITKRFYEKIEKLTDGRRRADGWKAVPGPPKTRARTLAKTSEYKVEFAEERNAERRSRFFENFKKVYEREPSKSEDYIWNIVDFARCSITVPSARDVLEVKRMIELEFKVVCIKNGYSSNFRVTGSGYRDLKLLVEVEFEDLDLAGMHKERQTTLICEIQILCDRWFENKKTTSISYKILRAHSLCDLFYDCEKYAKPNDSFLSTERDVVNVIKNGWVNIAKVVDFSKLNFDKLLLTSTKERWNAAGVRMLVEKFNADMEVKNVEGYTPLIMACKRGSEEVTKLLIELRCNIEHKDNFSCTAIRWAAENGHEGCVRLLLDNKAIVETEDVRNKPPLFKKATRKVSRNQGRISRLLCGEHVKMIKQQPDERTVKYNEMREAAIEDCLGQFFDTQKKDVPISLISQLLASRVGVVSLENILQILWFGGDVKHKYLKRTPLQVAGKYGNPETIRVLVEANAAVNETEESGSTALLAATRYGSYDVVKILLEAKANVNAETAKGLTPLLHAAKYGTGSMVDLLLQAGADINAGACGSEIVYSCADENQRHRESVRDALDVHLTKLD